jgi:sulfate permease, SulP family
LTADGRASADEGPNGELFPASGPPHAAKKLWSRVGDFLPLVPLLARYRRPWLRRDALAGLTLWALLVPQGLAYGQLAGLPPVTGLYVGLVAMLAYALLGSSRYLTVGPESSVAMIVAVELGPLAGGDPARYAALAGMLALLVGGFLLLGFAARLGLMVRLLSAPVLTGYLAGSGIVIAISQLPKLTGISTDKRYPRVLSGLVHSAETVEPWAVAIGLATAVFVVVVARFACHIPAGLAALALATIFVAWAGLADTIDVVGHVQGGLPGPAFPDVSADSLPSLLGPAGSIALLVFASSILTAQALAARDGAEIRPNREFLALGGANLVAGLFQGFPANGSDSRSFVVADSGGRSQLTGVVGAALLVITLIALTPLFRDLPSSALGAVVLVTALKLIDVSELRKLWRVRTSDFTLALVTLAGVLLLGVLNGIVVGVVASLLEVLRRAVMPHTAVLGRLGGPIRAYRDVQTYEDAETIPGLIVYRFDAPLFFANADVFRNQILRLVDDAEEPVRTVVVNAEAIYDVDTTGINMLERLHGDLEARSVRLVFARLKTKTRKLMQLTGLEDRIGAANFFLRVEDAADDHIARTTVS